jgi:transcriptional regulator NrdR family protein
VKDSRPGNVYVRRRRSCFKCGARFTTFEANEQDFITHATTLRIRRALDALMNDVDTIRQAIGASPALHDAVSKAGDDE